MEKITERKTTFENKDLDYSLSFDFRIQATEKRVLDIIDEFACEDIETTFEIYNADDLKATFSRVDYNNDNVDLTLKQGASVCQKLHIYENITQLAKNEKNEKVVNLVKNRVVKITY